jgi:hypothetical protein
MSLFAYNHTESVILFASVSSVGNNFVEVLIFLNLNSFFNMLMIDIKMSVKYFSKEMRT